MIARERYKIHQLTPTPPLGWNSYDCFGAAANERVLLENLEVFCEKLQPHGYDTFVVDNGWFAEYRIPAGKEFPEEVHSDVVKLDAWSRVQPSDVSFPNGLKPVIDAVHAKGLKFGIHMMRGIPRQAVEQNLAIKGTNVRAADIADKNSICVWCHYNYGVDMDKPGAQEFYDSLMQMLADWEVDFIKYDDIIGFPKEIEAVAKAIAKTGRDMVYSLSPGGQLNLDYMESYQHANTLRITKDVWDRREDLQKGFERWEQVVDFCGDGFWLDLDMIPFGHLVAWRPAGIIAENEDLGGLGNERMDLFTPHQKRTFITMRALGASPLFMGGNLPKTDDYSFELITNKDVLECNQNAVTGRLAYREGGIDVWKTPHAQNPESGWMGIFNRGEQSATVELSRQDLGLKNDGSYEWFDVWANSKLADAPALKFSLGPDDVVFLRYKLID